MADFEDFQTGGTGGAIFGGGPPHQGPAGSKQPRVGGQQQAPMGDDYQAPAGLPDWKQPSFDDDDHVDPRKHPPDGAKSGGGPPNLLGRFFLNPRDQGLAVSKVFYLLFFSAFGSLFPMLGVYYKQLGMDAAQTGLLSGVRPIVEYLATPFWNKMCDRFRKGKVMLLVAVASWIIFTLPIGFIHPPVVSCKFWNGTTVLLKLPNTAGPVESEDRFKRDSHLGGSSSSSSMIWSSSSADKLTPDTVEELPRALPLVSSMEPSSISAPIDHGGSEGRSRYRRELIAGHQWLPGQVVGQSPQIIDFAANYDVARHKTWVSPPYNNEVFERGAVYKVFFLLLLLVAIGEFFSSPAIALADSAVITLLGEENQNKYSNYRMFGSIGWGATMFVMSMVLDHSKLLQDAKCDMNVGQRNYNACFFVFAGLMFCSLLVATQLPFNYGPSSASGQQQQQQQQLLQGGSGGGGSGVVGNNVPMNNAAGWKQKPPAAAAEDHKEKLKEMASKTKVFAQQLRAMPEFVAVFRALTNLRLLMCMLVAWIMGVGMSLISVFLFWHLQDYGGTPTLFGIASVINHLSEIAAHFLSLRVISKIGHVKVLAAGLLCNVLRFLYISVITWPWLVLPFEFVQGLTHAAVWAACCSFISHNTDAQLRPSAQGFLQGVHHGFGKFSGAVFGGMLIKSYGTVMVFRVYGVVCAVFFVLFVLANFYNRDEGGISSELPDHIDPKTVEQEGSHLAPTGVSSGLHIPRALSSSKLEDQEPPELQYGSNSLGVPGGVANNPFLQQEEQGHVQYSYDATGTRIDQQQAGGDQQYYGRGYTQAQSGYSSSGFGLR